MRIARLGVAVGLAIVLLGTPIVAAQSGYHGFYSETWYMNAPFVWGNLTYNNGQGGIAWDGAASADNAPPDPHTAEEYSQATTLRDYRYVVDTDQAASLAGQRLSPEPHTFTFTSAPTTQPMVLNVSRSIQLELFLKIEDGTPAANICLYYAQEPELDIKLWMGDRILGGSVYRPEVPHYINWYWHGQPYTGPTPPSGYAGCYISMGAEADVIPAGTVLKLDITFTRQDRPYTLGLAGDHRSTLKFPLYDPEELLFRFPELGAPEDSEGDGDEGGSTPGRREAAAVVDQPVLTEALPAAGVAGLGLLAVGATTSVARGRRTLSLFAILATTIMLSGCLVGGGPGAGNGSQDLQGNVSNSLIKDQNGLTSGALGSVVGQVFDDLHIPIKGVHVSLIGLSNFTETNSKGRFTFPNLLPAMYKVRFDKASYKSFEGEIEVKAGFVSRPEVMLYLVDPKDRDARPHTHDYWPDGAVTKNLMDDMLGSTCTSGDCLVNYDFRLPQKGGEVNSIMPGTVELEITLTWDSQLLGEKLGLGVRSNDRYRNWSVYAPRASGVPFHIASTWEMTDPGHQPISTWDFHWYEANSDGYLTCYLVCTDRPDPANPTGDTGNPWIKAKVIVKKGSTFPLEPGHPDRWKDQSKLQVMKNYVPWVYMGGYTPESVPCEPIGYTCPYDYFSPAYPTLVPDGTLWLEVTLTLGRAPDPAWAPILYYKPANMAANKDYYDITGWKTKDMESGSTWQKHTWKIKLEKDEADFIYARSTNWQVAFRPDNMDAFWQDWHLHECYLTCSGPLYQPQTYSFNAWAYNTAM